MKFGQTLQKDFRRTAGYLHVTIPRFADNKKVFDAFVKYAGCTEELARAALVIGTDPVLEVADFPKNVFGAYRPAIAPNEIIMAKHVCRPWEKANPMARNFWELVVDIDHTVMHEMVHFLDFMNGGYDHPDQFPDAGWRFEYKAWGFTRLPKRGGH